MAHCITVRENGKAEAAFSLTPAWHGLGEVFDHPMLSWEAITAAGLDWEVLQRDVGCAIPKIVKTPEGDVDGQQWCAIPGMFANVRGDNGEFLGIVSHRYQIIQNREAFAWLDSLVDEGQMEYESAFSLNGGKRVVMVARTPKEYPVAGGDTLKPYLMFSLSHDGMGAIKFGPCITRPVCANTVALAEAEGTVKDIDLDSITHKGNVFEKLDKARELVKATQSAAEAFARKSESLAKYRMTEKEWSEFLNVMVPSLNPIDPDYTELRAKRLDETRSAVVSAFNGPLCNYENEGMTAWAAFNAITQHVDHLPRRGATARSRSEARFNVAMYGAGRDLKLRAFEAACRVAGVSA